MNEEMTFAEMHVRYPEEWVVIKDPIRQSNWGIVAGTVIHHTPIRDDVVRTAEEAISGNPRNLVVVRMPSYPTIITRLWFPFLLTR